MQKFLFVLSVVLITALILAVIFFGLTPMGRTIWNTYRLEMHKIDDRTTYEQKKTVEDTCRSMIASWNADVLTYKQYKDSDSKEQQGWAEQAKMRANKTAATYNEYMLKNGFVFNGNIPSDIYAVIGYIED